MSQNTQWQAFLLSPVVTAEWSKLLTAELRNAAGHMGLNKKKCPPHVLLCQNEPDQVGQMITVTQNTACWSTHPAWPLNVHMHSETLCSRLPMESLRRACGRAGQLGMQEGVRENIWPSPVREAAVWPHLWFRFPLKTPDAFLPSECTCRVPIGPPPGPFHRWEYTAQPPPPLT